MDTYEYNEDEILLPEETVSKTMDHEFHIYFQINNQDPIRYSFDREQYITLKGSQKESYNFIKEAAKGAWIEDKEIPLEFHMSLDDVDYILLEDTGSDISLDNKFHQGSWREKLIAGSGEFPAVSTPDSDSISSNNGTLDHYVQKKTVRKSTKKNLKRPADAYPLIKQPGRQSSNVWSYFESDSSDLCVAHCKLCQTRVKRAQGTSNLRSHMMKHHPAIWNRQTQQYKASNYLNSPSTSESCDEPLPKKQLTSKTPKITEVFSKITSLAPGGHTHDELTNAILFMIAKDKLPMSMVENEGFRYLCSKFKPLYNIPSRKTISTALEDRYKILKERFVTQIQQATTYSLTLDNWSDRTKQTYIAVTIHYLNNQWELIDGTIGMFPLYDNHTAEYLKNAIEFILDDFKLEKAKIVGVTTDRAANILKAVHELFGPKKQVSCFCHMLAQLFPDFMEGMSKLQIVIKKVRAIVNAVRVSTCASTKLKNLQKAKGIQEGDCLAFELDVSTRWNSTLYMIKKFLILKDYVLSTTEECAFPPELLQHEDYQILDDVIPLMELVENATKEASKSKYPTASLVVPLLANIKIAIGNCKTQTQCGKEFQNKFTDALERRGRDLEANDILGIATILDPRFKKKYFQDPRRVSYLVDMIIKMTGKQEKKQLSEKLNENNEKTQRSIWDIHDDFMEKRNPSEHVLPEIKQYLNQQLWPRQTNPIQVWKDQLKPSFPGLYPLAMMYLSVPCSSVPSERINSQAGDIKTVTRNRITDYFDSDSFSD